MLYWLFDWVITPSYLLTPLMSTKAIIELVLFIIIIFLVINGIAEIEEIIEKLKKKRKNHD